MSQQQGIRRTVTILVAIVAVVIGLTVHRVMRPAANASSTTSASPVAGMSAEELYNLGLIKRDNLGDIKPFALTDHQEKTFDNARLQDKWSLIYFGYTFCPDVCPTTMAVLQQFKQRLDEQSPGVQVQYLLVSVDPERDTPERLAQYVTYFDPSFIGVTGEIKPIYDFALNLNSIFAKAPQDDQGNYLMDHSGNIVVVNPDGQYYGFFKPPFKVEDMVRAFSDIAK